MDEIFLQTKAMDDDTLALVGNAWKEEMTKREKEKLVLEKFGSIAQHERTKNNKKISYFLAYDGRKNVTSSTREGLIEKLYSRIEADNIKGVTLEELFEAYYEERRNDASISAQTSSYDLSNWNRFFKDNDIANSRIADLTSFTILGYYKSIVGRGKLTSKAFHKASGLLIGIFDLAIEKA